MCVTLFVVLLLAITCSHHGPQQCYRPPWQWDLTVAASFSLTRTCLSLFSLCATSQWPSCACMCTPVTVIDCRQTGGNTGNDTPNSSIQWNVGFLYIRITKIKSNYSQIYCNIQYSIKQWVIYYATLWSHSDTKDSFIWIQSLSLWIRTFT